jgi:hypothetical protein
MSIRANKLATFDHLKVFATPEAADEWFKERDPEGVAFEYEVKRYPLVAAGT